MYQIIKLENLKKIKQYKWFRTFDNPTYGFNVKMDVTNLVNFSKETKTSFFINALYLIMISMNSIEELRLREVKGEIRLYDIINPTFTVMKEDGVFENAGFKMINNYHKFYNKAKEVIELAKNNKFVDNQYNTNNNYDEFYTTCIPWISYEAMTHPVPGKDYESNSVPRVCWDKYISENNKFYFTLNITVSHCFVDGLPLSNAFKKIQDSFLKASELLR